MNKDFDGWNEVKKIIQETGKENIPFRVGDIWWCSIGVNIGSEQDGKNKLYERPVLILRKFNNSTAFVIPLTSNIKDDRYHFIVDIGSAILSQHRLVSVKRLQRYVYTVSDEELREVREKLIQLIEME